MPALPSPTHVVKATLPATYVEPVTDDPTPTASSTPSSTSPPPSEGPQPSQTPFSPPTDIPTATIEAPPSPLSIVPTTVTAHPTLPPREGGEWDMEAGFVPGSSPLGEDCPGWAVAVGWQAFVAPGTPASSCLNENKNVANIHRGERSQEITFDFISAEAGIGKSAQTIPGHRYEIGAWGKHVRSQSPVELSLGVDLSGGQDWQAASVVWYPWNETGEDVWVYTQVTVRASGETLTVFLKGYHPFAVQGGATLFDDVRVEDLGP